MKNFKDLPIAMQSEILDDYYLDLRDNTELDLTPCGYIGVNMDRTLVRQSALSDIFSLTALFRSHASYRVYYSNGANSYRLYISNLFVQHVLKEMQRCNFYEG
ncbi:hypothetical protein M2G88_09160 [Vibrio vulnificus]|nr:hypothetical protein [Vibrio vulnificus]EJZ7973547.1 hypothetical protein [Vibrio vulnificus]MCU8236189.1 hypothetical protein [Vibrio vulnificus]